MKNTSEMSMNQSLISRRDFLKLAGMGTLGLVACEPTVNTVISSLTPTPGGGPPLAPTAEVPTAVNLNVSPEVKTALIQEKVLNPDGSVKTTLLHAEAQKSVDIVDYAVTPSTDTSVSEIITGKDATGKRYLWNQEATGWVAEVPLSQDWTHPETAPFLELSAFRDGSANLLVSLYDAEHPGLIPTTAPRPYYKVNVLGTSTMFFDISLFRSNQYLQKGPGETPEPLHKDALPFAWTGIFQTKDVQGNIIYVLSQVRKNPTADKPDQTSNVFFGLDKKTFDFYSNFNNTGFNEITATIEKNDVELVPIFPPPEGTYGFDLNTFQFYKQETNPTVAHLLNQNMISMFTADEQKQIKDIFQSILATGRLDSAHNSVPLSELPKQLSHMIVFSGFKQWEMPPQ